MTAQRQRAAKWFVHIFETICAEIGYALALLDPFVQAARRVWLGVGG